MTFPVHLFELRNFNLDGIRFTGHCYRGLAAFRIDPFAPHLTNGRELWSITILHNSIFFPAVPVFRNIDDVCGAIWDLSTVLPWERPFTLSALKATYGSISQILFHYHAYPFEHIIEAVIPEADRARYTVLVQ